MDEMDQRRRRVRRLVGVGVLCAAGVAVALALIFTVGGVGKQKSKSEGGKVDAMGANNVQSGGGLNGVGNTVDNKGGAVITPGTVTPVEVEPQPTETVSNELTAPAASGDKWLASILDGTAQKSNDGTTCTVVTADDLKEAVETLECPTILLVSPQTDPYALTEQITVSRHVKVMGHPSIMPVIDGSGTIRSFKVIAGGFLDLSFVRIKQGAGITRTRGNFAATWTDESARKLQEDADAPAFGSQVAVIRGGAVALELGAKGAIFNSVIFLAVANTLASVQTALTNTGNFVGGRVYGGHVFVAAGSVNFFNCHFWDTVLLLPFTDQITVGGDVLVVAGEAVFTGCTWTATTLIGSFGCIGCNVAVLGGVALFTFCIVQGQSILTNSMGVGMNFAVGGGLMVITGMDFRFVCGALSFIAVGDFFTGAGAMIQTGFTIENAYGLLLALGAGFYQATCAGIHVQTGVTYVQFNGPNYQALIGASIFVGTGASINTGVASVFAQSTGAFTGQGGFSYNGAGYSHYIGCPISVYGATFAFMGTGATHSQNAGFLVYIGNPQFSAVALSFFAGLGSVVFLGAGAAVLGYSPGYFPVAKSAVYGNGASFWINGYSNATGTGEPVFVSGDGEEPIDRKRHNRMLADVSANGLAEEVALSSFPLKNYFGDVDGKTTLLARDINTYDNIDFSDDKLMGQLGQWVDPNTLKAGKEFAEKLGGGKKVAGEQEHQSLYVNGEDRLQCSYCNVDSADGPGVSRCDGAADCNEMSENEMFSWDGVQFKPTLLSIADLTLQVPENQTMAPATALRDAMKAFIAGKGVEGVHVTVFPKTPEFPTLAAFMEGPNPTAQSYKAVFVTDDATKLADVSKLFNSDSAMQLTQAISGGLNDLTVNGVEYTYDRMFNIPAYNTDGIKQVFSTQSSGGSNAVRLVENGAESVPIVQVAQGHDYEVVLDNFPANKALAVQLIGSSDDNGKSVQTSKTINIATLTDKDGQATVTWTVPADLAPGEYYIKAADLTGTIFGSTGSFNVVTGGRRRKLYGPLMYL